ncbi:MAG: hypothetical protein EOO65_03105 [Methanosarcinales archaeon]|nr:MAG: hypothetical protein EOO65_03105 [Methanosarcinales archaeon]
MSLALQRPYLRRLREAMQQWRRVCVAEAARDARGGSVQQVSDDVLIIRSPHTSRPQTPLTAHISGYGSAMPSRAVSPLASFIDAITDDARNVFGRKGERVPGSDEASPPSKHASQPVMEQLAQPAHTLQHKPGSLARMPTAPPAITAPGVRGYDTSAIDAQAVTGVLPSFEGTRSFLAGDLNTSDASGDTERARCLAAPPPPENVHAGAAASTAASRARSRSPTHLGVDEFFRRSLRPSTQSGAPEASLHMTTGFASQAGLGLGMSTMRSSSAGRARSVSTEPARSERAGRRVGRATSASARTSSPRATVRSLVPTQPITAMLSSPMNVGRTLSAALCSPAAGVELSASTRASGMSTRATAAVPSSTHPFDSRTAQAGVPAELRAHQRSSPHRESAQELAVRAMMQSREEALRRMVGTADDAIIALAHIATNTPLVPPSDGGLMDAVPSLAQQSAPPRELDGSSALQRQREAGPARVQHAERAVLDGSSPRASNTMQQERSATGRSRRSDARAGAHEAKQAGGAKEPAEQRLSPIPAPVICVFRSLERNRR